MTGIVFVILGILLIASGAAGVLIINHILRKKKRKIREEVYQIYD